MEINLFNKFVILGSSYHPISLTQLSELAVFLIQIY